MSEVVGIGACVLDTLINCDNYPTEDTKQKAKKVFVSGGGPVGNALVVMSKLGIKTEVLGAFSDDENGKFLLNDFNKYGILTDNVKLINGTSAFTSYIIIAENKSTRTCIFNRGTVPDSGENIVLKQIEKAKILHLDGNYLNSSIYAAQFARKHNVKVSLDAGGLYEGIENLLPYVDILIPSMEFAEGITGKKDINQIFSYLTARFNPQILVITDGKNGGYYYEKCKVFHYDSYKVNAVDTNGAGDTFHGAFISAYLKNKSIKDCCDFASKVSAYKCSQVGLRNISFDKFNI